jgi:hypothetical protein
MKPTKLNTTYLMRGTPRQRDRACLRLVLLVLALTALNPTPAVAQAVPSSSSPIRLGIIMEEPASATAADLLAVELSHHARVQLLERTEIDRGIANRPFQQLTKIP